MNNPLTLIRKPDASAPRPTPQQRQKPRRDRRTALKAAKNNAPK